MKRKIVAIMILCLPALWGVGQAKAVDYQGVYHPTEAPQAIFQSTSAYSVQWQESNTTPMLNSDGSLNGEAYMGSSSSSTQRGVIRKGGTGTPGLPNPGDKQPLGDGLWVLMVLACAYMCLRVFLKKRVLEGR